MGKIRPYAATGSKRTSTSFNVEDYLHKRGQKVTMARKEKQEPVIVEDIHHEAMDEMMGDRFGILRQATSFRIVPSPMLAMG
jgi:hypothetical protein